MRVLAALLALALALPVAAQEGDDRHEGYYYPEVTSTEEFTRVLPSPRATREERLSFIASISQAQLSRSYPPQFIIFAKGAAAEKLIIVGTSPAFETLFRARAVMAQMTTGIRQMPFFAERGLQYNVTFYDMLQMLDFGQLTITDGETWAHRVNLPPSE